MRKLSLLTLAGFIALAMLPQTSSAQSNLKFSGVLFSDYSYTVQSPGEAMNGENAFGFRRVYLTTDYKISDDFSGRFRLEAADNSTTTQGKPAPFVKDLYLKWSNALGDGHNVSFGAQSPGKWNVSEKMWGYRSLEKTIMDRTKIASSRDLGVVFTGPITADGRIKYNLMAANNSGGKAETDKYKRVYGQLEIAATESISLSIGGDYYQFEGGSSIVTNAFLGFTQEAFQIGLEGYINPKNLDVPDDQDTRIGVSVFGFYNVKENHRFVARFDMMDRDNLGAETTNNWAIFGYAVSPTKGVEIIPNLIYDKNDFDDNPTVTGRLTVSAKF